MKNVRIFEFAFSCPLNMADATNRRKTLINNLLNLYFICYD